jgi:hypothetical protein
MRNDDKKGSVLASLIKIVIFIIVMVYIFPNIAGVLLDFFDDLFYDISEKVDTAYNMTDEYYKEYPPEYDEEELYSEITYEWYYRNRWLATWKVPVSVINNAIIELNQLKDVVTTRRRNKKYDKYYKALTDNYKGNYEVFWDAVYKAMRDDNEDRVEIISRIFKYAIKKQNLSTNQAVEMILNFVQNIEYYIPEELYFEVYPPINTIMYNKGDCDSKSLLIAMLLEDLGYDAILLYSYKYLHAMAGININGSGSYIEYKGKKFYFMETTGRNWKIGMIPSETNELSFWHPIDL